MPELSEKQIFKAVSQYLRELGIDRNYVDAVLREKIEARNPEELVRQAVCKYFNKGPDGWRAEDFVLTKTKEVVNETIKTAMASGVREQLDTVIDEHVRQITSAFDTAKKTNTAMSCAITMDATSAVYVMNTEYLEKTLSNQMLSWFAHGPYIKIQDDGDNQWSIRISHTGHEKAETSDKICRMLRLTQPECVRPESLENNGQYTNYFLLKPVVAEQIIAERLHVKISRSIPVKDGIAFIGPSIENKDGDT